ncbi:MAG: chemotaxis protein CheA [Planctomycetes bacterium]|nr:chemotaxis protein CheA [Planctomycetota bacterium]MBL7145792.1 chemotaxis protein CheA [Phycisphaerae bacterium]
MRCEKLTELIEQAASAINMISATDLSEIENLQKILDQIKQNITEISDGPAQLLEEAQGRTSEATEALQEILRKETQDTARSIEIISQAISTIQSLANKINPDNSTLESEPAETDHIADVETATQETTAISEKDAGFILDFITEAYEHIESAEAGLLNLGNQPDDKEIINQVFCGFHMIKGLAAFLNLTQICQLAHWAENLLDLAGKNELSMTGNNIENVFEAIDMMKKLVVDLEHSAKTGKAVSAQYSLPQLLAKLKESVENHSSAPSSTSQQTQEKDKELDRILSVEDEPKKQGVTTQAQAPSGDEKIKVSTARLDNLVNMVGELVVAQLMVSEEVNTTRASEHNLCRKIAHQSKIIRDLQQLSMSIRMVPIGGVFQKMARLVRDLSRKSGKEISFTTTGDETELDRTVVDKISDPLVHMLRNAIDHGVEPPEERTKIGKNPKGRIELQAYHEAGNIVIEIEDDGKGLNKERILKKAIDKGIVSAEQELSKEEVYKLIFHPGLSTAQKVTSVSGRGVGMDVVKKSVESLHGRIDISSTPGKGSIFTIRMPLTLAIIDGQIIRAGNNRYIIPINSIDRSLKPTSEQLSSVHGRGEMAIVQGNLTPIIRLYRLFGIVPDTEDPTESLLVVVEDEDKKCCLLVDELLGQQQVVIKSLGDGLGKVKGVSGGAIMGDGRVSLILDIPNLIELANKI